MLFDRGDLGLFGACSDFSLPLSPSPLLSLDSTDFVRFSNADFDFALGSADLLRGERALLFALLRSLTFTLVPELVLLLLGLVFGTVSFEVEPELEDDLVLLPCALIVVAVVVAAVVVVVGCFVRVWGGVRCQLYRPFACSSSRSALSYKYPLHNPSLVAELFLI